MPSIYARKSTTAVDVCDIENHMFTNEPGRTYHRAMFYGTSCDEALLTYVPEDVDGVIRAHMWIGGAHYSSYHGLHPRAVSVGGFPGSCYSIFRDAYSVIFFDRNPSLPVNRALSCSADALTPWYGDILVVKHVGHNHQALQSISFEEKALIDAFLSSTSMYLINRLSLASLVGSVPLLMYHYNVLPNSSASTSHFDARGSKSSPFLTMDSSPHGHSLLLKISSMTG
ncbi:hypothetical protein DFJ58DRAFT_733923 [Suillus subalutaceus]|uniref:uncharacterized protein n=1 Tax=Suillus subalutaceus TaxID=48586 RepID=UPI001B8747F5|nr:uncharacterized protein DFJ58DRAFT_733923 [Suillus subalutaceus]KAG1838185.1 hypothetical protein DFJ58DRAFT_733923 [Suillus subalutaceus]